MASADNGVVTFSAYCRAASGGIGVGILVAVVSATAAAGGVVGAVVGATGGVGATGSAAGAGGTDTVGVVDNDCAGCHCGGGVSAAMTDVLLNRPAIMNRVCFIVPMPPW